MDKPWRFLIGLISAIMLFLTSSPGLLEAALVRVAIPHCHCACNCDAHAGPVTDHHCHCHHDDDANEQEPTGDGSVTEDHTHCPCCPLRPRGAPGGGCCLVKAPFFSMTALSCLPSLQSLTPLSPEASLLFPFVTPSGLIRPPRA